jgi:hypothetical protein
VPVGPFEPIPLIAIVATMPINATPNRSRMLKKS